MITGAILIVIGIIAGYILSFVVDKKTGDKTSKLMKKILARDATVIDMTPLDLGDEEED